MKDEERGDAHNEMSPGGSAILRHDSPQPSSGYDVAYADDERICAHIEEHLGENGFVWHELVSFGVHIDIHVVEPTEERPFVTLVTSGMSARPMTLPPGLESPEEWRLAELMMVLPPDWNLSEEGFEDERHYWPVRLLKSLARLPGDMDTWLGWGHSVPNGHPAEPYAPELPFSGALVIPPILFPEAFRMAGEPPIRLFQVVPVTDAEMEMKLELGLDAVLERLEEVYPEIYGPLNIRRPVLG
ncbi:suppressor of fused domain protein [Bradymonadaceae bacterium TMQ3]|nr:suppressor of fused domain protein [Bradymonadaceae bacterium TMQ3]TXC76486.1 suppressor of fused domain protein [Bradymonadales bacterium TMQ1]